MVRETVSGTGSGRKRPARGAGLRWAVLGLTLAAPAASAGQVLVGTVAEEGTGRPLVGAFVQLRDTAGTRVAGVLSDADGRFTIRAPTPGRYAAGVALIGYAGTRSVVTLERGSATRLRLEVPVEAVSLGSIRAEVTGRCHRDPEASLATARLWDEARKALELAAWTERQRALRFQVVERVRTLAVPSLEVLDESERGWRGYYDRSPYQSIPAEELARDGYVQRQGDDWYYYAPDARVLLSDSFLATHCFRIVGPPAGESEVVGLGVEPVPERDAPDIEGVLWLDRETAELRRLEFRFVNLPQSGPGWDRVGGRVEFERLPVGMWVVRRWYLRMPHQAALDAGSGRLELVSVRERAAEVRNVTPRP